MPSRILPIRDFATWASRMASRSGMVLPQATLKFRRIHMGIRKHTCKRKTRCTITVVFSAPDPHPYIESSRSSSKEIEQKIVPAKSEMEDILALQSLSSKVLR